MVNIALFNLNTYSTHRGVINTLHQHHNDIKLLVLSDPYKGYRGSFLKQVWNNWQRSGLWFVIYLFFKIPLFAFLSRFSCAYSRKTGHGFSVKGVCQFYQIPCISVGDINAAEVQEQLSTYDIDLITIYYFDQILKQPLIDFPTQGVINFHPSNLPLYRGLFPIFFAYNDQQKQLGITAHWIKDETIDSGDIVHNITFTHPKKVTCLLSLDQQVSDYLPQIFTATLANLSVLQKQSQPQKQANSSYNSFPSRKDIAQWHKQKYKLISLRHYIKGLYSEAERE